MQKFSVIITGATGMVGEGVLHECLLDPNVEQIMIINRRPSGYDHPKLKEVIVHDFYDYDPIRQDLAGYDACFFCLGVTSVGRSKDDYFRMTYTLTMKFAEAVIRDNPAMAFCYVSGAGTDSTEKGMLNWARVKGKTENDLFSMPFKSVFAFRPGFIKPTPGLKFTHSFYKYINWMFPVARKLYKKGFCTLEELGKAMIRSAGLPPQRKVLEGDAIINLSKQGY